MFKRIAISLLLVVAVACTDGPHNPGQGLMNELGQVTAEQWLALSQRTIYFGHQSVGNNIMDGVRELVAEKPQIKLRVVTGRSEPVPGVFNEFQIGENTDPDFKNADFLSRTQGELGPKPVLILKYCFVDIEPDTDVQKLLERYQQTLATLRARHPHATIVHVTVPLTVDSKFRNFVNVMRGRPTRQDRNGARTRYNELLRAAYAGKEPIYDLAAVESTRADGTQEYSTADGRRIAAMAPEWASDEGHLNAAGSRRAGADLLVTLALLPDAPVEARR